ncbi:MAG: hypothetical protein FRX48_07957 [Lasallia pustulata]|uniref:Uncharacterized protein n=1 Tax=Lasallia pustulata TaxID=136370 RepID=A0A5M8PG30_9LECA|nr:MAG: hypothetical protein FRX48_07957 [Lasallia pustulata]
MKTSSRVFRSSGLNDDADLWQPLKLGSFEVVHTRPSQIRNLKTFLAAAYIGAVDNSNFEDIQRVLDTQPPGSVVGFDSRAWDHPRHPEPHHWHGTVGQRRGREGQGQFNCPQHVGDPEDPFETSVLPGIPASAGNGRLSMSQGPPMLSERPITLTKTIPALYQDALAAALDICDDVEQGRADAYV